MRNGLLLPVLFLLLVTSAVQAQEIEPAWLEVANVPLRLRSGPSTDDDIITQLTPREAVVLLERGEQWSHIRRQDGTSGWAHNDYLLPWDERNRPDARRRVGEKRLFRVQHWGNKRWFTVNAELGAVSEHAYFYVYLRGNNDPLPLVPALQELGEQFDGRVYRQSLEFWGIEDPPDIDGDERVVVLIADGFSDGFFDRGWYTGRASMPQEPDRRGTGFIGYAPSDPDDLLPSLSMLAHEFRHMLHHQTGGNDVSWVDEGLATFWEEYLEQEGLLDSVRLVSSLSSVGVQLNRRQNPNYFISRAFMYYIYERLGRDALREFAARPETGLDALDAVLEDHPEGLDADSFFADWVLANYLFDNRREGGRYGYQLLDKSAIALPTSSSRIRQYPGGFQGATPPYSVAYHELPLHDDSDANNQLLLDFRLGAPPPQDAWLQLVQVLPDSIDVQRFRASDYRNQPVLASLGKQPQQVLVAVSPFTTSARQRTGSVSYSLAIRQQPAPAEPLAQVTSTLNLRSNPEIADNVLARLRRCSLVQVLRRGEEWSQVLTGDGLGGWSHNDYLLHLQAPAPGASPNSCAALTRAAHDGNLAAVQGQLAAGVNVNARDAFGRSALHEAAFWGHRDVIARLLRAGADVEARDSTGRTPLDEVILSGDADSILLLARAGVGLDLSDPAFRPLIIDAAATGNNEFLEEMLANHDVNWRGDDGPTALHAAAANGQEATVWLLLTAGADHSIPDARGRTPLLLAAANGRNGALAVLHKTGAYVNHVDDDGYSPLMLAAANGHATSVAWLLLASDVYVNQALGDSGRTALHLAAANGHDAALAMLLLGRADPAALDLEGFTPRQLAEAAGHGRATSYLNMAAPKTQNLPLPRRDHALGPDMLAAARSGDLAEVERLFSDYAPVRAFDRAGLTPLMLAARGGHQDVALRLLLAGADPDERENLGWDEPAIFYTIRDGHDDITAMLLLAGAFPAALEHSTPRMSALMWAADFGREDVVHLLLGLRGRRRLNVNERSHSGWTPLFPAAINNHVNIVRTLLAAGADVNARDRWGQSALNEAAWRGHREIIDLLTDYDKAARSTNSDSLLLLNSAFFGSDLSVPASLPLMVAAAAQGDRKLLDELLAAGHDVNWRDASGQTALAAAARHGQVATLNHLLAAGANLQWQDETGRTPLMLAAASGQVRTLGQLHDLGQDVHQQDSEGHTALTLAAANGHPVVVTWFLLGNSDVDLERLAGVPGRNALHLAAARGHETVVALLLLTEMDIDAPDAEGNTALQLAESAGHHGVVELLRMAAGIELAARPDWQFSERNAAAFFEAARNGDLDEVDRLIRDGMRLNFTQGSNRMAISHAAGAGQRATVLRLLLAGASTYKNSMGPFNPVIYYALDAGHDDIALLLLYGGARPGGHGYLGTLALLLASGFDSVDLVQLILAAPGSRRIQPDLPRDRGFYHTPLFRAVKENNFNIAEILLEAGANPNLLDRSGVPPLYFAVQWRNLEMVRLLLAAGADPNIQFDSKAGQEYGRARSILAFARSNYWSNRDREIINLLLAAGAKA
ncbi:MAG: ankyrin repeat domain-containing protein [Anaerolineaceae bacterium]|nr:ankyrin repeat domain-containing protein [Anaerolineaceae bacterium]